MRRLLCFFCILVFFNGIYGQDYVNISNCPSEFNRPYYIASDVISIEPEWITDEKDLVYNYNWTYEVLRRRTNTKLDHSKWLKFMARDTYKLVIPKYGLIPGFNVITVTAKRRPSVTEGPISALENDIKRCLVSVRIVLPAIHILGGPRKIVPANEDAAVDASLSFDPNFDGRTNDGFDFVWTCTQRFDYLNFCNRGELAKGQRLTIPARNVRAGDLINVTLATTLNYVSYRATNATQVIEVERGAVALEIRYVVLMSPNNDETAVRRLLDFFFHGKNFSCRKNCVPEMYFANYRKPTLLHVQCSSSRCDNVGEEDYLWTVTNEKNESFQFDYSKTRFGRNNRKFYVEKDAFVSGNFLIEVEIKPELPVKGYASFSTYYSLPPEVERCELIPKEGISLETDFTLSCVQNGTRQYTYELYAREERDEQFIIEGITPELPKLKFHLPVSQGKTFHVLVLENMRPYVEFQVEANVRSSLADKSPQEIVDFMEEMYKGSTPEESIDRLVSSKSETDRQKGIQKFDTMVNELVAVDTTNKQVSDYIEDLKYKVAEDFGKAPAESLEEILRITTPLAKLQSHNENPNSDPALAKVASTLCKRMVDKFLDLGQKEQFPDVLERKSERIQKSVQQCVESNTNPNYNLILPAELNLTTEAPIFDDPIATENYPNYVDHDDDYYKNLEHLKESTFNMINTTTTAAKIRALAVATGEGLVRTSGKQSETLIMKDEGQELTKTTFTSNGITVVCSKDFEKDQHSYDLLITTWNKDIVWWNPAATRIVTNVVNCEVWHSTCKARVSEFKKPAHLFFNMKEDANFTEVTSHHVFRVPSDYSTMSDEDLNRQIHIHRVMLEKTTTLQIRFHNLNVDDVFEVVLIENKFPTTEDFFDKTTVKQGNNDYLKFTNQKEYAVLIYLGILVEKNFASTKSIVNYEIGFSLAMCLRWLMKESVWVPACHSGNETNMTVIHCKCHHFSIFGGYLQDTNSLFQEVIQEELELELTECNVVFYTLVSTLLIYFLLMLIILTKKKEQIYFLGDNNVEDRFAYLVVVKTGLGYTSGTSSNIMIKLTGDKNASEPHVLNFPDPELRILQKFGDDFFILTTESHLGDLQKLEIWFDSIGPNPGWYCRDITVYDLQERKEWNFEAKKRLSLLKGEKRFVLTPKIEILKDDPEKFAEIKKSLKFLELNKNHTWCIWQDELNFSYIKKLTVVLSTILTIYALVLVFLSLPEFQLNDTLDVEYYSFGIYAFFVTFASSFPAFAIHFCIAWVFRLSKIQFYKYEQNERFPFSYNVACWSILIILIVTSTTVLTICGFWVSKNESLIWLTACFLGITFGIIIYEILFIYIQKYFFDFKIIQNMWARFTDIWANIEHQRKYLYAQFGRRLLRPYFDHLYVPLRRRQLKERLLVLNNRNFVISELQDLLMFGVYVVILYWVILADKDKLVVLGKNEMEDMLEGLHTRRINFHRIETVDDIYTYINETLIPLLHPLRWYGEYVTSEPGLLIDMSNKIIGVARLRQQRMMKGLCAVPKKLNFLNLTCMPEFEISHAETKTFGYFWGPFMSFLSHDRLRHIWKYSTSYETETLGLIGEFTTYSGGGYVAYLGRTLYNSYINMRKMFQKIWIDHDIRVIFIEFLTYNANYNVFSSITLILEHSASGYVFQTINIHAARMLLVHKEVETMSIMSFFFFVIWVILLFLKESIGVIKQYRSFYKDPWTLIDLIIILMSFICIFFYLMRMSFVGSYLRAMEQAKNNEFISYFYLFYIESFLTLTAAFLVCIATIRLWKFLRFAKIFRILERTLSIAAPTLLTFGLVFLVLLLASAVSLYVLLGQNFGRVSDMFKTVRLVAMMALKASEMELHDFLPYKTSVFVLVVYSCAVIISMYIFIMIIVMAYFDAQMEFSGEDTRYNVKQYVIERGRYLQKLFRYKYFRLRGGQNNRVGPKADKFLYMNSMSVPAKRMKYMECVLRCVIRKRSRNSVLSKSDVNLMLGVCRYFLEKRDFGEVEVFFKGRVRGTRIRLVDERHIEKIANVVNLLLQDEEVHFREKRKDENIEKFVKGIRRKQESLWRCELKLKLIDLKMKDVALQFKF